MATKKDEFTGKVLNYFGLGEVHPIYVAVPVGIVTGVVTLTIYRYYMGSSRKPDTKRIQVERQLAQALETVKDLEGKLYNMEQQDLKQKKEDEGRPIRIFMDGAFDMMHYGHMNAFRQGRALGTHLVVGVNSDESIKVCKGPPVCGEKERLATVRGCKWVDEVVENVPYVMSDEYLRWVIDKYDIDYVVHGDDPCIVDGRDCYEGAVKLGKYLTIPRTEGISTTDIVGRMLLMTKDHHTASSAAKAVNEESVPGTPNGGSSRSGSFGGSANEVATPAGNYKLASSENNKAPLEEEGEVVRPLPFIRHSRFLTTSRTIRLFGAGVTAPKPTDRVVYLAGAWDMFHAGHIEILENARKLGDYVIVGVHNDSIVNQRRGMNLPIMNLHERVLSVLGCKWVDDVLIDAPYIITEEMIQSLNISVVVTGAVETKRKFRSDSSDGSDSEEKDHKSSTTNADGTPKLPESEKEAYRVPKEMGILTVLPCSDLDSGGVLGFVQRIQNQRKRFTEKYKTKAKTENQYYTDKYKK